MATIEKNGNSNNNNNEGGEQENLTINTSPEPHPDRYGRRNILSMTSDVVLLPSPKARSVMKRELNDNLKNGVLMDMIESIKKVKEELLEMHRETDKMSRTIFTHEVVLRKCIDKISDIQEQLEGVEENNNDQDIFVTPSSSPPINDEDYNNLLLAIEHGDTTMKTMKCPTVTEKVSALLGGKIE